MHISVLSRKIMFFQINLEASNKALLDLQESYRLAISTLKEKDFIISKLLCSGESTERDWQTFFIYAVYLSHYQIINVFFNA